MYHFFSENKPKKPSDQQMRCMIDFMERHQDFANGRDANSDDLWRLLLTLLHQNRRTMRTLAAKKRVRYNLRILFILFLLRTPCNRNFSLFLLRESLHAQARWLCLSCISVINFYMWRINQYRFLFCGCEHFEVLRTLFCVRKLILY